MRALRLLLVSVLAAAGISIVVVSPASAAATVSGFSQCQNGAAPGLTCAGGWVNGSLNSGNSSYAEDRVVPQRALISLPADNLEHSLTFTYQDRKGAVHSYDSLATWNKSVVNANPCQGIAAALCAAAPSRIPMTSDPAPSIPPSTGTMPNPLAVSSHELAQADRQWTMYGAVLTSDVAATHSSPAAGDDLVTVTVKFRNATPGTATTGVLLFGGHLAVGAPATAPRAWGPGLGATSVSGGPYSFKLEKIDGSSTGATANSIQAGGVAPLPPAVFAITKTASVSTAAAGSQVTYTITVRNTGGQSGATTFTDDYNNNLTNVVIPAGCSAGVGAMTCTTGTIQPDGQQVFTYTANLPSTFSGGAGTGGCTAGTYPVSNTATLANATSATAVVCVNASAQFSVTKTVSNATPNPGQSVTYTITVTNGGNAAGGTTFTDDYDDRLSPTTPAGCTSANGTFSCTTGSIAANGGTQVFTYTATMPATFSGGTTCTGGYLVSNQVAVTGGPSVTRDVCVQAAPAFSVVKTVSDTTALPGQTVTYTLTVSNTGKAAGSTVVTDTPVAGIALGVLPSGCVLNGNGSFSCSTGTILAGGTKVFSYTATMPPTFDTGSGTGGCLPGSYPITNTATTGASTSTVTVCVGAAANFTITKTASPAAALPGQLVTYTVKVKNIGAASGTTTFVDDYDNNLTPSLPTSANGSCTQASGSFSCSTGSLLSGATATFTYTATMPSTFGATSGGSGCAAGTYPVRNSATLASGPHADNVVCVTAAPAFAVTKTVNPTTALPGAVVTYTVTVSNNGAAAGSTSFVDDYDDRLTLSTATTTPTGGSCSAGSGLNLTSTCSTSVIAAGGQQVFTFSASLPTTYLGATGGGTCAPGTYRVANTATLANQGSATAQTCVTAAPVFTVDKTVSNESPLPGAVLTYTITVSNTGSAAGSTTFTDDYDNRLTPSVPSGCSVAGGVLTCSTGTILAGTSQAFSYTATLPATYTGPGGGGSCAPGTYQVKNTVTLGSGASDSVTACVAAAPAFVITKTADDTTVVAGATVAYTVTVTNNGAASGSTSFTDDYDNRLSPTLPAGCTANAGSFTCTTGDLASGAHQVFGYTAVMPATFASTAAVGTCAAGSYAVANTATLTGGASAGVQVCVEAAPGFSVTKTVDDTHVGPGDLVTYTVTVKNTGTAAAAGSFTDTFDNRLSPSEAVSSPAGNNCSPAGPVLMKTFSCTTRVLDPGQSQTFTYSAAVPTDFTGASGGSGCPTGEYPVLNKVSIGSTDTSVAVCVAATPSFTITKSAEDTTLSPGGTASYTVVVRNTGHAPGATTFTDDYDASATVASPPVGCTADVPATAFTCTTGTIAAGGTQTYTYTALVPATFIGAPSGTACDPAAFPIVNRATLANGTSSSVTVCVGAVADFSVTKTVDKPSALPGDTVHYTVVVTNTGTASGSTTVVDDYDNRLTPTVPAGCTDGAGKLTCTTGTSDPGSSRTFEYDAVLPTTYSGESGTAPCAPGQYSVSNSVTIAGATAASRTVCVTASARLTVTKVADDTTADPGQVIGYRVTVSNTGSVAASTSFTDDYDDRLTPSVPDGCTAAAGRLTCTTGTIQPGAFQVFIYTATMPATYSGASGLGGCPTGSYPVANSVVLENGANASATVCVAAASVLGLVKTATLDTAGNGDQTLTYTLTYTNSGPAQALAVVVSDPVPTGTTFVSCAPACSTSGGTVSWSIPSLAAAGGTGSVSFAVKVTSNQVCTISNTAQVRVGSGPVVPSNTVTTNVTPQPDTANAKSSGSAAGLSIRTSGLLDLLGPIVGGTFTSNNTLTLSKAASSQNGLGGPATSSDALLGLSLPSNASLVKAGVLTATSASSVTAAPAEARQTTTSEVASVCVIPVAGLCTVESGTVRAVATTMANGGYAAVSTAGSTIENLRVAGVLVPVDLNQTTTIPLNKAIFGANSYVAINERTSSAGLSGQKYAADQGVAMIHVKITGLLLGVQAAEVYVAQATAHSEFPKTFVCAGAKNQAVSGHAYTARLYTGPLLADLIQGYAQISPLGGAETEHIASAVIPSTGVIVNAQVGDSSAVGSTSATGSTSRSFAEVAGDANRPACVLSYVTNCVAKATVIRSEARSTATGAGSTSTDAGTSLVGLSVFGIPIAGTPAPNTTLVLPGIGFIILNEQFCDNGAAVSHTCTANGHTGITVRAVRVVVTVANNILGLSPGIELVVAEAHADSTFG